MTSRQRLQIRWTAAGPWRPCRTVRHRLRAVVSTYRVFGNFWDEPEHIAAGLVLIDRGEYLYDTQHPPLARLAAAIGPYLAGARFHADPNPIGEAAGRDLLYNSPASYERLLTLARLGVLPFLLVLLAATWLWVRRWYGEAAALLALVFLAATPVILGHAARGRARRAGHRDDHAGTVPDAALVRVAGRGNGCCAGALRAGWRWPPRCRRCRSSASRC